MLFGVNQRLRVEDVDSPLVQIRPVKTVLLAVITGDRGLCGGYNNQVIKKVDWLSGPLMPLVLPFSSVVCLLPHSNGILSTVHAAEHTALSTLGQFCSLV